MRASTRHRRLRPEVLGRRFHRVKINNCCTKERLLAWLATLSSPFETTSPEISSSGGVGLVAGGSNSIDFNSIMGHG